MAQPPETLVERRSGRSAEEFGIETDLSLEERISRFEAAEYDLGFAEASQQRGHNRADVFGSTEDIGEAIVILKASADYRASMISIEEIQQAEKEGLVSDGVAQALIDRKRSAEIETRIDRLSEHFEQNRDLQDRPGLDRDDEQER